VENVAGIGHAATLPIGSSGRAGFNQERTSPGASWGKKKFGDPLMVTKKEKREGGGGSRVGKKKPGPYRSETSPKLSHRNRAEKNRTNNTARSSLGKTRKDFGRGYGVGLSGDTGDRRHPLVRPVFDLECQSI